MTEEESQLEYERQLATLPPMVAAMMESMRERMYELEDVIAWVLAQLDRMPGSPPDRALRFLSSRANYLERSPDEGFPLSPEDAQARRDNAERVALLDYLREQLLERQRHQGSEP
ncbi:hypothetical protein [Stutzerimonas balearica]|uniref:hypothetical protein n=1 Tax=Stutzerimonas balearica TaxID=74829 RepID=UPI0019097C43|nr:hypothetical protein [Stutzerimonas balearica]MBK3748233.1 hypothetical protein [Stutzerimonas balearica]MBK3826430.1 hypothetical protein [Stutzerimonas balearica]MBK3856120.1 hypothetical protein [Stutzerimonas balearica]